MGDNETYNKITRSIIGAAIEVHQALGPGLLESAYEACLAYELGVMGLKVETQKPLPLVYKNVKLDCGYRLDMLIKDIVIVEIKSIDLIMPIHHAQVLSYLKLSGCKVGLLINFNETLLKHSVHRIFNGYVD
jgi:GxxExxY protein